MKLFPRVKSDIPERLRQRLFEVEPATIGHYLHFGFMDPKIQPVFSNVKIVGSAFTVKAVANDSAIVHKAVSLAEEGDVLVIDRAGDRRHACVGEMVAYAAKVRKLAGIIIDGPSTDVQAIREMNFPVFSTGLSAVTTKLLGLDGEINTPVQCGGVCVHPGDLIFADDNGIVVLPGGINLNPLLDRCETSQRNEPGMKQKLDEGTPLSAITEVDRFFENN